MDLNQKNQERHAKIRAALIDAGVRPDDADSAAGDLASKSDMRDFTRALFNRDGAA